MQPTDANDPLQTSDHDPCAAASGAGGLTADCPLGSTPDKGNTATHRPAGTQASDDVTVSVSVPGYEIEGVLGRGGMGVVYKARHLALKRTVALKMMLAGEHAGQQELARFRLEAEAVARLQHPNIVQIHEVGEAGGHPYCALEFVEGGSLAARIAGKPLPAREAAKLMEALARAMQLAHSRNVVHRDLKPANILVTADGTPKISDFGLARHLDSNSGETQAGAVMGTPSYMAPEQASGRAHEAGPVADVYALGAILYDCLAGRPPFKGKTVVETLDQVRTQEPVPPSRWQPSVPMDLETICLKCLRKEPEGRCPSAEALADDLLRWQDGKPIAARPVGTVERVTKWMRRNPVMTGLLASSLVAALALVGTTVAIAFNTRLQKAFVEADDARRVAETQRGRADEALLEADRLRYFLHIAKAHAEYRDGDMALVEPLLDGCPPGQRTWEWRYLKRLCHQDLLTLKGEATPDQFYQVSFHPEGQLLATAGPRGTVTLWNVNTGQVARTLQGSAGDMNGVAFSPNGSRLAVVGNNQMMSLWDVTTGRELYHRKIDISKNGEATVLAFDREGRRFALASWSREVYVWNTETGDEVFRLTSPDVTLTVAFSPNGSQLATGSEGPVRLWDTRTGRLSQELDGHTGKVFSVAYSPDGKRLVSGSTDQTVRVWDTQTGRPGLILRGHTAGIAAVAFSPDGQLLASCGLDQTVKLWDLETGQVVASFRGHTGAVTGVAFDPRGPRLASIGDDATVKLWDTRSGHDFSTLAGHAKQVRCVAFSPDGSRLVSGSWDTTVKIWDALNGRELRTLKGHTREIWCVAFSPDGKRVASGGFDASLRVWDAATGEQLRNIKAHANTTGSVAFSPDGTWIASAGDDGLVKLWDANSGREIRTFAGHDGDIHCIAFSPDGKRLASGGNDRTVKVWDPASGKEVLNKKGHTYEVWSLSFSPDGKRLASGSWYSGVKIWDAATGEDVYTLSGHTNTVLSIAFAPDGTRVASASFDGSVKIWDTRTGQEVLTLRGHRDEVPCVTFSPDGNWIASASGDRTIKLWDGRAWKPPDGSEPGKVMPQR